MSVLHQVYRSS